MRISLLDDFRYTIRTLAKAPGFGAITRDGGPRRRMALGADRGSVMSLVMGDGLRLAAVGATLGVAGAYVFARMAEALLYGVALTDPVSFVLARAILAAISLAASYLLARRAARVDPILALRWE